jgi:hypothetical protein
VTNGALARRTTMWKGDMGDARRVLDEAVSRSLAQRTAWVRQFAHPERGAPGADDLRLEGAVDLRRRVAVVAEATRAPAPLRGFAADRTREPVRFRGPVAPRRPAVYAGGSRYVATAAGWEHVAGHIDGPRCPSDPMWLLDALRYAEDCVVNAVNEIVCRLDLRGADDLDRSAIVPAARWRAAVRPPARGRRADRLRRVPCLVAVGADGAIARMSYAAKAFGEHDGLVWTTTELVEYGVPVEIPDLAARARAAVRGAEPRAVPATR